MRVHAKGVQNLLPLPDNPTSGNASAKGSVTGSPPARVPEGKRGGDRCPTGAPQRAFDVVAFKKS